MPLFRTASGRLHAVKGNLNPAWAEFMGIDYDGEEYDFANGTEGYKRAYLASVWAMTCIRIRAQTIEGMPRLIRRADGELLDKKSEAMRFFNQKTARMFYRTESSLMIWGTAFWRPYIHHGKLKVNVLNPSSVEVYKTERGITHYIQRVNGSTWYFKPDELVYFHLYDPDDDLGGLPPTAWILKTVGVDAQMDRFAHAYFENDATPGGYFYNPSIVPQSDAERQVKWWQKWFQGVQNKGRIGYLDAGTKYESLTPVMNDLAVAELDEKVKRRIGAAYGVPTTISGMDDAANFSTAKEQHVGFYTTTILPQWDFLASVIDEQFMPRWGAEFFGEKRLYLEPDSNSIEVLQEDRAEVTQRAATGFQAGFTSFNAARVLNGEEEIQGGDFFILPNIGLVTKEDIEQGRLPKGLPQPPNPFGGGGGMFGGETPEPSDPGDLPPEPPGQLNLPSGSDTEMQEQRSDLDNRPLPTLENDLRQPMQKAVEVKTTVTDSNGGASVSSHVWEVEAEPVKTLVLPGEQTGIVDTQALEPGCAILLNFANNADLVQEAAFLKQASGPIPGWAWHAPSDYHVTLVYLTSIMPENLEALRQAFGALVVPDMTLHIGSTGTFSNSTGNTIHFAVDPDPALMAFQQQLFDLCQQYGAVSPYSVPSEYKPHITLVTCEQAVLATPALSKALIVKPYGAYLSAGGGASQNQEWVVLNAIKMAEPVEVGLPPAQRALATNLVRDAMAKDLERWHTKASRKGAKVEFRPDALPSAYADFIRMDLDAGRPLDEVFGKAGNTFKAIDPNLPTPEEFEAYWNGIGDLYDGLNAGIQQHLAGFLPAAVDVLKNGATVGLEAAFVPIEQQLGEFLVNYLQKVFLAGAARGNVLLANSWLPKAKAKSLSVSWDLMNQEAERWAKDYAAGQVTHISEGVREQIRKQAAAWVEKGNALEGLAAEIEKLLLQSGAADPSLSKVAWLQSPERAALIAQTESTDIFHRGVQERWKQAGVQRFMWRTQNDGTVCELCRNLNNQVGDLALGIRYNDEYYSIPAHPNCRCFAAPMDIELEPEQRDDRLQDFERNKLAADQIRNNILEKQRKLESEQQKLETEYLRLKQNVDDLDRLIDAARAAGNHEEARLLEEKAWDAMEERVKVNERRIKKERSEIDRLRNTLHNPEWSDFSIKPTQKLDKVKKDKVKEAVSFLNKIGRYGQTEVGIEFIETSDQKFRASWRPTENKIQVGPYDDVGIILHEFGHGIESNNPAIARAAEQFLKRRVQNRHLKPLRKLAPGWDFRKDEYAYQGAFQNDYTGKVYLDNNGRVRATEIVSMGIERLYRNPSKFAAEDPEYFNFIVGILRGDF